MRRLLLVLLAGLVVVPTISLPAPASATYAGQNGLIAFKRGNDIYTIGATGTGLRRLTYEGGQTPRWSRDGKQIVFTRNGGVWVMQADGSGQRRIATGKQPTWSPAGRIVYVGRVTDTANACDYSRIYSITPSGTDRRALTPSATCYDYSGDAEYSFPGYGPTGDLLYEEEVSDRSGDFHRVRSTSFGTSWNLFCDGGIPYGSYEEPYCNASYRATWFQPNYQPTGRNYLLVSDVSFTGTSDGRRRLYLKDAQSTWRRQVGTELDVADPTSSPDGKHALYSKLTPGTTPVVRQYTFATGAVRTLLTNATQADWQPLP